MDEPISIADFKKYEKHTLHGFLSVRTTDGLVIKEVCLHEKNGRRWLSMPARQFKRDDGSVGWTPMVEFADDAARARFQASALAALDAYLTMGGEQKCS
jgi:hypothetical protein